MKRVMLLCVLGLGVLWMLTGCDWITQILNPPGGGGIPWTSGTSVAVGSQSIGPGGGTMTVSDPGGPIDGMTITVPAGAYPTAHTFHVSHTAILGDPSPYVTPLTPLITVENGGEFASKPMTVTIPVTIPDGYFAMGFLVGGNGELEGMPLIAETSTSITVATAHFSSFLIGMIADSLLTGVIDTGFRPMTDDWQFPNNGSYIEPGGHCAGQSLTAMWYYLEKTRKGTSTLWNRFDNNGDAPATPDFWEDDSFGYRFASMVQHDIDWDNWLRETFLILGDSDDPLNWRAFLFAMKVTNEPQYVAIYSNSGGHAMIVYKADADTGTLYIADPNYPGHSGRRITYANGTFAPYESGANKAEIDAGNSTTYDEICYFAKTALVPWSRIAARWSEFEVGTIGDGVFPACEMVVLDDSGGSTPLTDGMAISGDKLKIRADSLDPAHHLAWAVRRGDEWLQFDSNGKYDLLEGDNHLGIYIVGNVDGGWEYVDFQWLTLKRTGAGYVVIVVNAHAWLTSVHPNEYNQDTGELGVIRYSDTPFHSIAFKAYANRSFTGNTYTGSWSGWTSSYGEGPYTGSMTVTFSESMDEIISFSASDSQTFVDGNEHSWSVSGANIPRLRIGNGFYEYQVDDEACCAHLSTFHDDWAYASGDSMTVSSFTCDVYSEIEIHWYETPPAWVSP